MASAIYVLCALTSLLCAVLLYRGYRRTRVRLLLWSTFCFVFLVLNNVMLIVDLLLVPTVDLNILRLVPALLAVGVLIGGFILEDL